MQQIIFNGNVGRAPEMRYTPSGQPVTNFSVAVNEKYKNAAGEPIKKTVWFRVQVWGKLAEICNQYVIKGMKVMVMGKMVATDAGECRVWKTTEGEHRASFEVNARSVEFLSSGAGVEGDGDEGEPQSTPAQPGDEGDIPF